MFRNGDGPSSTTIIFASSSINKFNTTKFAIEFHQKIVTLQQAKFVLHGTENLC